MSQKVGLDGPSRGSNPRASSPQAAGGVRSSSPQAQRTAQSPTTRSTGGASSPGTQQSVTYKGKVVVVGEFSVGKTCLSHRFITKSFTGISEPTIGAAFQVRTISLTTTTSVTLEIWDTAGSERYRSLMPMYFRDACGAVVCYDITSAKSFERAASWIDDFRRHNEYASGDATIVLAGTKYDLAQGADQREVEEVEARGFAEREELLFFETSAKTDYNVSTVFMTIAEGIAKLREQQQQTERVSKKGKLSLRNDDQDDFYARRKKKEEEGNSSGSRCSRC